MKKVLLGLTTLLLISCVNLDEPKVQKVVNSPKSSNKNNVVKTQKEEKKKAIPTTNKTKVIKTRNLLKEAEAIQEDSYANKIKKYKAYKSLTAYNPSYKAKLSSRINELLNKIEKTYNFNVIGADLVFQDIIDNGLYDNIENKIFTYSTNNPDVTLQIEMSSINYNKPVVNVKTIPKEYSERYTNKDGNEILNVVKYYENETTETSGLTFIVEYKLVSNLTGEVLVSNRKSIEKNYNESWKTYYISSFRIDKKKQIPSDEKEKHVPAKQEIYKAAFHEMFDTINKDINSLPSVK
ncbi:Uncharacterised protein [Fusobacterium polymorphum]|uniref:Lipoprotein n=1 Tax=Fusobacterium polymorphum ATCC 10953 TaxID=393480 RepID=A5TWK5_FUSNP|nr:hypothetical protein [Fusobacterium polymorphum]EDK89280.1 hypothetical protein FNP_1498 [Fusobacterium polymorphum ATCC 10953]UTI52170.1 hypothetical protein NLJ26_07045 [Fusobacterium polymorphum]WRL68902.1 hypothetical protein VKN78_02150 [Fusobacterium polymorphum]WRL76307.1 hypothetical protein VKN80_05190 [Fusobacterium polymorphum]CKG97428.1 Uncharacterised protein [Fusobacterium polymorphum]